MCIRDSLDAGAVAGPAFAGPAAGWKRSNDSEFKPKRDRIVEPYAAAEAGEAVVICLDEFGPLNLQPQPGGKGWAPRAKPKRIRATYKRPHGVRHLLSAFDVGADRLYGHIKTRKGPGAVP